MPDGYLQAFISILHNYGNLTNRGDEYRANKKVSEVTWTTYNGDFAEALRRRRVAEWKLITEGLYMNYNDGNTGEIDWKYPYGSGTQYSEEKCDFDNLYLKKGISKKYTRISRLQKRI